MTVNQDVAATRREDVAYVSEGEKVVCSNLRSQMKEVVGGGGREAKGLVFIDLGEHRQLDGTVACWKGMSHLPQVIR
jgi:hypothetical protein